VRLWYGHAGLINRATFRRAHGARGTPPADPPPAPPVVNAPQVRQLLPARRELHRDPVEPPLLDPALTWRELVLQATLNGQLASQGALFAEDKDGRVAVELAGLFCAGARRRVDRLFHDLWFNDDAADYAAAKQVLAGRYTFAEKGLLDLFGDKPMVNEAGD
jgi:hypothetical protein